jgi:hypothetical protein
MTHNGLLQTKRFLFTPKVVILLSVAAAGMLLWSCAAPRAYRIVETETSRSLVGRITWQDWQLEARWNKYLDADYVPDAASVQQIRSALGAGDISFRLIAAAWCSDSREEMPRLYAVFAQCGVQPDDEVELWGVNLSKTEPADLVRANALEYVPTLIVLKKGVEIGRVVENPVQSWERDIAAILQKKSP